MPNPPLYYDKEAFVRFIEELMGDESLLRVSAAVAQLCDLPVYELEAPFGARHVSFEESPSRFGTVYYQGKDPAQLTIATNEWFPSAVAGLFAQKTRSALSADTAIALAADFANAYAVLARGHMREPQKPIEDPDILAAPRWEQQHARWLFSGYRAAARVALTANDVQPVDLFAIPPVPDHLMSFGQPLSADQITKLTPVFESGEY